MSSTTTNWPFSFRLTYRLSVPVSISSLLRAMRTSFPPKPPTLILLRGTVGITRFAGASYPQGFLLGLRLALDRSATLLSARGFIVHLMLVLIAISLLHSPALADDASAMMGRWLVPSSEQKKSRMSPHCQQYAETDVQTVPESEIEIFSCDDPAFAPEKTRILEFVKSVNEVYRAQHRPVYSETISGLCAVVRETTAKRKSDLCNPSKELRGAPIENLPIVWNVRPSDNNEWPLVGDSYSPSSGYGAISCFKRPGADQVMTRGCRRWGVELPLIGAPTCDCGCEIVCDDDVWIRK